MAAPKKCKSLYKRRIAQGDKMKNKKARAFNGISVRSNNVNNCETCTRPVKSHHYCHHCTLYQIKKSVFIK